MRAAAHEYFKLMLPRWWCLALGMAAGFVGLLADMEAITMPLPSWIWWCLAFGALGIAQFWAFYAVHREITKFRSKPEPTEFLSEVFDQVFYELPADDDVRDFEIAALNAIRGKAISGNLQIFGTKMHPKDGDGVMEPIDMEFWKENTFAFPPSYNLSRREERKRSQTSGKGNDPVYYNLPVDPRQASLCWPRRRRLKLQWPVKREVS